MLLSIALKCNIPSQFNLSTIYNWLLRSKSTPVFVLSSTKSYDETTIVLLSIIYTQSGQ
jgi:hypothetical protein